MESQSVFSLCYILPR